MPIAQFSNPAQRCHSVRQKTLLIIYPCCYLLFSDECLSEEKYTFNFTSYHPYGVSSLVYDEKNQLLIAAGNYGKEPFVTDNGKVLA